MRTFFFIHFRDGSVSAAVGSKEYTDITEKKSEDYVILKTEGKIAYIALTVYPAIHEYGHTKCMMIRTRVVITTEWGEIQKVASIKRDTAGTLSGRCEKSGFDRSKEIG